MDIASLVIPILAAAGGYLFKFIYDNWTGHIAWKRDLRTNTRKKIEKQSFAYRKMSNYAKVLSDNLNSYRHIKQKLQIISFVSEADNPVYDHINKEANLKVETSLFNAGKFIRFLSDNFLNEGLDYFLPNYWATRTLEDLQYNIFELIPFDPFILLKYVKEDTELVDFRKDLRSKEELQNLLSEYRYWLLKEDLGVKNLSDLANAYDNLFDQQLDLFNKDWYGREHAWFKRFFSRSIVKKYDSRKYLGEETDFGKLKPETDKLIKTFGDARIINKNNQYSKLIELDYDINLVAVNSLINNGWKQYMATEYDLAIKSYKNAKRSLKKFKKVKIKKIRDKTQRKIVNHGFKPIVCNIRNIYSGFLTNKVKKCGDDSIELFFERKISIIKNNLGNVYLNMGVNYLNTVIREKNFENSKKFHRRCEELKRVCENTKKCFKESKICFEKAEKCYQSATKYQNPKFCEHNFNLPVYYTNYGVLCQFIGKLNTENHLIHMEYNQAKKALKYYDKSIDKFLKAIGCKYQEKRLYKNISQKYKDISYYYHLIGNSHIKKVEIYYNMISLEENVKGCLTKHGFILIKLKKYLENIKNKAIENYLLAISINPTENTFYMDLAKFYEKEYENEKATYYRCKGLRKALRGSDEERINLNIKRHKKEILEIRASNEKNKDCIKAMEFYEKAHFKKLMRHYEKINKGIN